MMDSRQRLLATIRQKGMDRVAVAPVFSMSYLRRFAHPDDDFLGAEIAAAAPFACDPMHLLKLDHRPGGWPDAREYWLLHRWAEADNATWNVTELTLQRGPNGRRVAWRMETPSGALSTEIEYDRDTSWIHEYALKSEADVDLLLHRPDPASLPFCNVIDLQLSRIGSPGIGYFFVPGVWHQACDLRGSAQLAYDLYDRPGWVRRLFATLREYTVAVVDLIGHSQLQLLGVNESYVGLGISPRVFRDFILQEDRAIVQAIHGAGLLTSYHICGKSNALLELMADTEADCIETLTPPEAGGDNDLGAARLRLGNRVAIRGGFNQHLLASGDEATIASGVRDCLDQAARAGAYILAPSGFLTEEVSPASVHCFCETAHSWVEAMARAG